MDYAEEQETALERRPRPRTRLGCSQRASRPDWPRAAHGHAVDRFKRVGHPSEVPPPCAANCAAIVSAHDASGDTGQNCDRGILIGNREFWPVS